MMFNRAENGTVVESAQVSVVGGKRTYEVVEGKIIPQPSGPIGTESKPKHRQSTREMEKDIAVHWTIKHAPQWGQAN